MSKANDVEISLIFRQILGPLVLSWVPNHFVLGAQLAPGEKRLVCIPVTTVSLLGLCNEGFIQKFHF